MTMNEPPVTPDAAWLARLIGVRSSKPSYYREYRHTSSSLDRSIRSLEPVSRALTTLTGGPQRLAEAVLRTAGDIFGGDWAALAVEHPAFPGGGYAGVASAGEVRNAPLVGSVGSVGSGDNRARTGPPGGTSDGVLTATMTWEHNRIGWLAVQMPAGRLPDDTDAAILRTLANQAVVAIQNSWLYAESERLRAEATQAYEELAQHVRALDARDRQLREVRSALVDAREQQMLAEERQRIARELHDTVAQYVLTIGMNLEWCLGSAVDVALRDRLSCAKELARDTVQHIRDAIFALSSVGDPQPGGLISALRRLASDNRVVDGPVTSLRVVGSPVGLPPPVERGLYMIAREALFNVVVHAKATRAWVRLGYGDKAVRLSVSDDGAGDPAQLRRQLTATVRRRPHGYHQGLANMVSRTQEMGGKLSITRGTGGGVRITVTVPLAGEPE
jgi:signal transduction histidine kinase